MKAVNLLPREDAPRKATGGGRSNTVAIVAGAGGLLVVLALAVATTVASNHVSSARADLDASRAELARTPAHASSSLARNRLLSARERRTLALAPRSAAEWRGIESSAGWRSSCRTTSG